MWSHFSTFFTAGKEVLLKKTLLVIFLSQLSITINFVIWNLLIHSFQMMYHLWR